MRAVLFTCGVLVGALALTGGQKATRWYQGRFLALATECGPVTEAWCPNWLCPCGAHSHTHINGSGSVGRNNKATNFEG